MLALLAGSTAHAADGDEAALDAAIHFKKGSNAYRAGDLAEAVTELKAAVKLKPTPNGIFALGQALREKGELAPAAHQYRQYLVLAPTGPFAEKSKAFLRSIEGTLAATRRTQDEPPQGLPADVSSTAPITASRVEPSVAPSTPPAETPATLAEPSKTSVDVIVTTRPAPKRTPVYKRWWLWTTVAVVAVGLGVGLGVGLTAAPQARHADNSFTFMPQ